MKRILLGFGLLLLVVYSVCLFKVSMNPQAQQRSLAAVRSIPAPIFYGFTAFITATTLFALWGINSGSKAIIKESSRDCIARAYKIALSVWRVEGEPHIVDALDTCVIRFRHPWWTHWYFDLTVHHYHVDSHIFLNLQDGMKVGFIALDLPLVINELLQDNLCEYLRIKVL